MLTRYFLQKSARSSASRPSASPTRRSQRLMAFDFPGNVRQLENICHWLTVMAPAQVVEAKDLPPELLATAPMASPAAAGRLAEAPAAARRAVDRAPPSRGGGRGRGAGAAVAGAAGSADLRARGAQPARSRRAGGLGHADAPVRGRS